MGKLFAVGDIHGMYSLLIKVWDKLINEEHLDLTVDKVIFLGDMIDRGLQSKEVLDFIWNLTTIYPQNVIALAGNHCWLAIDAHIKPSLDTKYMWAVNGGDKTLMSFGSTPGVPALKMPDDYIKWMAFLPLQHTEPGFFMSHAPAPAEWFRNILYKGTPTFQPEELLWTTHSDECGVARTHGNGVIGVSGHIHALRRGIFAPRIYKHHVYADAGCGCSPKAPLCAIELNTMKVIYAYP